jgi:hypothetical protein
MERSSLAGRMARNMAVGDIEDLVAHTRVRSMMEHRAERIVVRSVEDRKAVYRAVRTVEHRKALHRAVRTVPCTAQHRETNIRWLGLAPALTGTASHPHL